MIADTFRRFLPGHGRRPLTDEERTICDDILDAAHEWSQQRLPLAIFATIGRLPHMDRQGRRVESAGYARFVALAHADADDHRRSALRAAIDALVRAERPDRSQRIEITRHGIFAVDELAATQTPVRSAPTAKEGSR